MFSGLSMKPWLMPLGGRSGATERPRKPAASTRTRTAVDAELMSYAAQASGSNDKTDGTVGSWRRR
jgi:hypothetical protein